MPVNAARLRAPALLAAGVLVLGAADAALLALTTGYFGGGYNSPVLRGWAAVGGFVLAGALLDAFLLVSLFAAAWWGGGALRLTHAGRLAFASSIALFLPLGVDVVSHRLHRVFGHVVGVDVLVHLAGGRMSDAALEGLTEAPGAALLLGAGLTCILGAVVLAGRIDARLRGRWTLPRPSSAVLGAIVLGSAVAGAVTLSFAGRGSGVLAYGLERKPSARLLLLLVRSASDVDFDGYGLLSRPADPASLDPRRHPFALEIPGNRVDENGLAGDLPPGFAAPLPFPVPSQPGGSRRPSILLIFLESFRGDIVGFRFGDREVTPTLNRLAQEGASSTRTYAHSPLTWPSRAQLFQGRIDPMPGAPTLIDDFHALGYRVAYFSGQNDMHGGSEPLVGFDRADVFYDARADRGRRTSRTALPVSLQVSSSAVLEQVRAYLDATRADPDPLFLYVNLVDNHFPYHHEGLERMLGVEPVGRSEIRPENARRVFETYLQASANVDAAIGELVGLWRERMGDSPLLVTGDHGQSFYENGMLGHGQAVDEAQSRVPLIVVGIGGRWPEPLGLSDLRGLLLTHLFAESGRPRFEVDPSKAVFQYAGSLERPAMVGLRSAVGSAAWQFSAARGLNPDQPASPPPPDLAVDRVIWTWEFWQRAAATDLPAD